MGEGVGLDALAPDQGEAGGRDEGGGASPAGGAPVASAAQEIALRQVRGMVRGALPVIPRHLAVKYNCKALALTPQEHEDGTEAYTQAIDALFPDLEKLTKFLAIAAVVIWTGSIFMTRLAMVGELKRRARARRAAGTGPGDGAPDDVEDAEDAEAADGDDAGGVRGAG